MPSLGLGLGTQYITPLFRGVLDDFGGAAAAYSLRKLSNSTGDVVRVRRSFDDSEQDFNATEVTDGSLVSFANNDTTLLYNNRMYFDGVNDKVLLTSTITLSGDFSVTSKVLLFSSGAFDPIIGNSGSTGNYIAIKSDTLRINFNGTSRDIALDSNLNEYQEYEIIVSRLSGTISVQVDGVVQSATASDANDLPLDQIACIASATLFFNGLIYDVNINNVASYQGYGNTDADWEDQIGSNDGTVNGSPALYTGQGFNGFVSIWYDQSGNGSNAVQSVNANQPQIVSSGSLVANGIHFNGSSHYFIASGAIVTQPNSSFMVVKHDTGLGTSLIFDSNADNTNRQITGIEVTADDWYMFAGTTLLSGDSAGTNKSLLSSLFNSTSSTLRLNGTEIANGNAGTNNQSSGTIIGSNKDAASLWWDGTIEEIVMYSSNQSANASAIETNINDYYGIY